MAWRFDPDHSQVEWASRYLGISTIKGSFDRVTADVYVEDADPSKWSIAAEIDAGSVSSAGFVRRLEAMPSDRFLDAQRFPKITFRSTRIQRQDGELVIDGDLTLHGVTKPASLRGRENGEAVDGRGNRRRGFSGHMRISRTAFEIPPPETTFVPDEVDISFEIQLLWGE
ncbi:MAG TPA: YceI family protein [Chloroflexota bacterium]|nr:YceI family protein [Chloroflexota bacterium]